MFITGGFTAAMSASHGAIGGLVERLTIGGFMQWLFVTTLWLLPAPLVKAEA